MSSTGWLATCRNAVFELGLDPSCLEVLEAFRGAGEPEPAGDFERLETQARITAHGLAQRVVHTLDGEIDLDQADMFGRRYLALTKLLGHLAERVGEARILRIGAAQRMTEILEAPRPRALRVRALVDFYTSRAALLHHRQRLGDQELPSIEALAEGLHWREAVPGLEHAKIVGESELGPVHINLLRASSPRLQALDCRRMARRAGRDFVQQVARADALAAVSGGSFLYSEADIEAPSGRTDPVGLLLRDGEVHSPPVFHRATLLQDDRGGTWVRRMGLAGCIIGWRDHSETTVAGSNALGQLGVRAVAFNRAWGDSSPDHDGVSLAIVGHRVIALGHGALPIPLNGFVLAMPSAERRRHAYTPGHPVTWRLPDAPSGRPLHNGVTGGPMLLDAGRICIDMRAEDFVGTAPPATFSSDETFDNNLLPRMAAGLDEQDRLLLAAIDGRNFHRATGFTVNATARLMQALGCIDAMNLDGGSSKRMVLRGKVLDLPTTELLVSDAPDRDLDDAPVRPVHTAMLLHYRKEEGDEDQDEANAAGEAEGEEPESEPAEGEEPESEPADDQASTVPPEVPAGHDPPL